GGLVQFAEDGQLAVIGDEVRAVWNRRIWPAALDNNLDPRFRDACRRESAAALQGFLDGLGDRTWIDAPLRVQVAGSKLRQLQLARHCGMLIPRTLVSNDAQRVRRFSKEVNGRMVAKMLTPLSTTMERAEAFVYTSRIDADALGDLAALRHSPMVFQEEIQKQSELRAACVDGRLFVGAVDASGSVRGRTDWRLATPEECRWRRASLPEPLRDRISEMMRELELRFGVFDFIQTPTGDHVFLELNPVGEWGMLERDLGLPISDAIAAALLT